MHATDAPGAPVAPLSFVAPLALQTRWASRSVVGRSVEHAALRQEMAAARSGRLSAVTLEGEPGIGKSRLLVSAAEMARLEGFAVLATTADEELRGPFLLARSVFAAREAHEDANEAVRVAFTRVLDAMSGHDSVELDRLSPDQKLLRVFDLAAMAIRTLAFHRPVALLADDVHWADQDSVRMLRYIVRAAEDVGVFLVLGIRSDETAQGGEVGSLLADMQRLAMVRRLELPRLTQAESAELLEQLLGGELAPAAAATVHAQAEGVPFILEELARSYRDAGVVQQVEGVWRLGHKVDRLLPSAVRTLIQRRSARLPAEARAVLAEAAVIGRAFSLRDLQAVRRDIADEGGPEITALSESLASAVSAGLLIELPETAAGDYRFTHEHVREFAAGTLAQPHRRAIHAAIVNLLTADGDPSPESLPMLAQHALAAGDSERAARFACDAAKAALEARAPEEVLRIVDLALGASVRPQDRMILLVARDDALEMLLRPVERLESLAELGALAEALADRRQLFDTALRRAAALRLLEDEDRAAELAADIRRQAEEAGDTDTALDACLQQGQALLRKPIGESFSPSVEADLDGAQEAYEHAAGLASELDDVPRLAAATRELGVIDIGRARAWFVDLIRRGDHLPYLERIAAGERAEAVLSQTPIASVMAHAQHHFEHAVELFDRIGDRRGLMSSIIAMAYAPFALDIHLHGSAKRIEEIHRLATRLASLTTESGRDLAEAQMLYGVHVFARAKGVADLALARGEDAYSKSRMIGDTGLEFAAAGGVGMAHVDLGELPAAERWLDRAAAAAAASPMPFRTRQLSLWRGTFEAAAGNSTAMRQHLQSAVQLATDQAMPAARCEALARLALESASLGSRSQDARLLELADDAARETDEAAAALPGHPLWAAQAAAARTLVALARDDPETAAETARGIFAALKAAVIEDLNLEIVLPAARALMIGGTDDERAFVSADLRRTLAFISQRIFDDDVRVRWLRGPLGRELRELVGSLLEAPARPQEASAAAELSDEEVQLLNMLVDGRTNAEISAALGLDPGAVATLLTRLYAKIGTSSRAEATAFAFREQVM